MRKNLVTPGGRDLDADAFDAYETAVERAESLRLQWEMEGRPTTFTSQTGVVRAHPLPVLIAEGERLAMQLRERLRPTSQGREPLAVIEGQIGKSPSSKRVRAPRKLNPAS